MKARKNAQVNAGWTNCMIFVLDPHREPRAANFDDAFLTDDSNTLLIRRQVDHLFVLTHNQSLPGPNLSAIDPNAHLKLPGNHLAGHADCNSNDQEFQVPRNE